MIVLGLNGFAGADHDAAAAIVVDGRVVAAVEEERLDRRRHAPGATPMRAAAEVLAIAGVASGELDVVCHGWRPELLGLGVTEDSEREAIRGAFAAAGIPLPANTRIAFVEHHLAHFWSAVPFLPAGAGRDAIDGLVVDGAGESTAGALFRLRGGRVEKVWNLGITGSLGLAYEAATAAVRFQQGEEGKTMGLASYGRPQSMKQLPALKDDRFPGPVPALGDRSELRHQQRAQFLRLRGLAPAGASFNERADLALGVQSLVEQRLMSYLVEIPDPAPVLVMAGGVALNCTINAGVARWCQDRGATLTIPPPANDAGIAIGAAVWASVDPTACTADGAFLGRGYATGEIVDRLRALGAAPREVSLAELARDLVERDLLCGWFEGRAEVGPRALGRRSVLARTDSTRVRDRLNVAKGRETWRPLAPSVLADDFTALFAGAPSPYMLISTEVTPAATRPLAGVVHVDNTARPQAVANGSAGSAYGELLQRMREVTGRGAITCTSFNVAGRPIVYTPEQALAAATAMGLDLLAGDGWWAPVPR